MVSNALLLALKRFSINVCSVFSEMSFLKIVGKFNRADFYLRSLKVNQVQSCIRFVLFSYYINNSSTLLGTFIYWQTACEQIPSSKQFFVYQYCQFKNSNSTYYYTVNLYHIGYVLAGTIIWSVPSSIIYYINYLQATLVYPIRWMSTTFGVSESNKKSSKIKLVILILSFIYFREFERLIISTI